MSEEAKTTRYTWSTAEKGLLTKIYKSKENWRIDELTKQYNENIKNHNKENKATYPEKSKEQIRACLNALIEKEKVPDKLNRYNTKVKTEINEMILLELYAKKAEWDIDDLTEEYNKTVQCSKQQIENCLRRRIITGTINDKIKKPKPMKPKSRRFSSYEEDSD